MVRPYFASKLRQQRLDDYFRFPGRTASTRAATTFLSLPPDVRQKVYIYAGVGAASFVDLNCWSIPMQSPDDDEISRLSSESFQRIEEESDWPEPSFPCGLLRTCRTVHSEVEALLYSRGVFATTLNAPGGLRAVEALSDRALGELTCLVVWLCSCACISPHCTKVGYERRSTPGQFWSNYYSIQHNKPLGPVSRFHKAALAQWQRICGRLALYAQPGKLELYVLARVDSLKVADAIVQPLKALPTLRDAGISFDRTLNAELQQLARSTALQLADRNLVSKPFRFLDLPLELQLGTLEYTNLVIEGSVRWSSHGRCEASVSGSCCLEEDKGKEASLDELIALPRFCSMRASAYRTRYPCTCYDVVSTYFQVSKAFSHAARIVFYSLNKFYIVPIGRYYPKPDRVAVTADADDYGNRLNLLPFLKHETMEYLSNISRLTVYFPLMGLTYLLPEQKGWLAWLEAVGLLAQIPGLVLEVHMEIRPNPSFDDTSAVTRGGLEPDAENDMWEAYARILDPLRQLRGTLRAILIYIDSPALHSADEVSERRVREKELESMIMGKDYDSVAWGKTGVAFWSEVYKEQFIDN